MSEMPRSPAIAPIGRTTRLAPGSWLEHCTGSVGEVLTVVAGTGTIRAGDTPAAELGPGRPVLLPADSVHRLASGPRGLTIAIRDNVPRCDCC